MKYLCLAYYDPQKWNDLPKSETDAIESQCHSYDDALKQTGRLIVHGSLALPGASIIVRPRGGKSSITDGPYTESKEQVGGFFLVEAADRDEAIQLALKHPAAHLGEQVGWGIEIRPIEFFEQPSA
jgi:hypothetical protein